MSNHTPGPWSYSFVQWPKGDPLGFAIRPASGPVRTEKRGVSIASLNCAEPNITATAVYTTEELQANARLIAAAPALYEAAKEAIRDGVIFKLRKAVELAEKGEQG